MIGAGSQAITQILAIAQVRKLSEILVYDINEEAIKNLEKFWPMRKLKLKSKFKETAQKIFW